MVLRLLADESSLSGRCSRASLNAAVEAGHLSIIQSRRVEAPQKLADVRALIEVEALPLRFQIALVNTEFAHLGREASILPIFQAPAATAMATELGVSISVDHQPLDSGPVLLIRREVESQRTEPKQLPTVVEAPGLLGALHALTCALGPRDALAFMPEGLTLQDDQFTGSPGRCWAYSLHRLVRQADVESLWHISPGRPFTMSSEPTSLVLTEVKRIGLLRRRRLLWWVTGSHDELPQLTVQDGGLEPANLPPRPYGATKARTAASVVHVARQENGQFPVLATKGLLGGSPSRMRRRLAQREATQWAASNVLMLCHFLGQAWKTEALTPRSRRKGIWRILVPRAQGGGWLELRPIQRSGVPIVQLRRRSWLFLRTVVAEVECREETWVRLDGAFFMAAMRTGKKK